MIRRLDHADGTSGTVLIDLGSCTRLSLFKVIQGRNKSGGVVKTQLLVTSVQDVLKTRTGN